MARLVDSLANERRLALDTESDPFHRYYEKICLIQVSSPAEDFIVDPLAAGLPDQLRAALADPGRLVLLHGADYDVRCLKRSFDLELGRIFDTQIAASLLGASALGLKALLETELGITISKAEQRSDWGRRPLSERQLDYARQDTMHLHALVSRLEAALERAGRLAWLEEECDLLRLRPPSAKAFDRDGWKRIKGAKALGPAGRAALEGLYLWREEEAQARDRPPFRVLANEGLVALAAAVDRPGGLEIAALRKMRFLGRGLDLQRIVEVVDRALQERAPRTSGEERVGASAVPGAEGGTTAPHGAPPDYSDPVVKRRLDQLRTARTMWAKSLGLDPGFLVAQSILERFARDPPSTLEEVAITRGMTRWRVEAIGSAILSTLERG